MCRPSSGCLENALPPSARSTKIRRRHPKGITRLPSWGGLRKGKSGLSCYLIRPLSFSISPRGRGLPLVLPLLAQTHVC
jgi:hypothetical protein